MTYADLTAELDHLLHELEHDDVPLDALTQKVQRCYALIRDGRALLRRAEEAVEEVLEADVAGSDEEPAPPAVAEEVPPPVRRRRKSTASDEESKGNLPF